ncbi:hypothetical protein ACLB1E_14005 [Escherichia coli]
MLKAKQENRLEKQLQQLGYARVPILDEIGYLPMTRGGSQSVLPVAEPSI